MPALRLYFILRNKRSYVTPSYRRLMPCHAAANADAAALPLFRRRRPRHDIILSKICFRCYWRLYYYAIRRAARACYDMTCWR